MIRETNDFVKIDITGLLKTIWSKLWNAILAAALCAAIGWAYTSTIKITPMYRSTASLYFAGGSSSTLTNYNNIVICRPVLEQVIEDLGLNMSYSSLKSLVSSATVGGTNMVKLTAAHSDKATAQAILTDLISVSTAYAFEVMGMTPPTVFDSPTLPVNPYNVTATSIKYVVMGAVIGFAVVMAVVVLLYVFDNKVRNARQITWRTGENVIGILPQNFKNKKHINGAMHHLYSEIFAINNDAHIITFSSATPENKDELVDSFAKFGTYLGKKVIVVDTDMRLFSKVSSANSDEENLQTLMNYLMTDNIPITKIIKNNEVYSRIYAGVGYSNAYELLSGEKFDLLLQELRKKYDLIIINTTSLDRSMCAKAAAKKTDIFIMAYCLGKTKATDLDYAEEILEKKIDGAVITNVKVSNSGDFKRTLGRYIDNISD